MSTTPDYKISFGSIARTLIYEDARGTVLFTFDVDTENGRNCIILEPPSRELIEAEQLRQDLALQRVKQHLVSKGYDVEVFGR